MACLKPVAVKKVKMWKKRKGLDHNRTQTLEENEKEGRASKSRKKKYMAIEPPIKRKRGRPRKEK